MTWTSDLINLFFPKDIYRYSLFFFSRFTRELANVFKKNEKKNKTYLCTSYINFFNWFMAQALLQYKKKAHFVIFSAEQEFTNSCIENSMSKVEVWGLLDAKRFIDCDYAFSSSTRFQKRKEWICESKSKWSFTSICRIFLLLNPSVTIVYAQSTFFPDVVNQQKSISEINRYYRY